MTTKLARLVLAERYPEAKALVEREERAKQKAKRNGIKRPPAPGTDPEAKAQKHADETARIRAACLSRSNGWGELCHRPLDPDVAEMCHLDGGPGKRRQLQSVRNVVMEHHECHQGNLGFDRRPLLWLKAIKDWAEFYGYPVPERFRKLEALKGVPVRIEEIP